MQGNVVTVHVSKGKNAELTVENDAKAEFTNNLPTTNITVNKTWLSGSTDYAGKLTEMFGDVTVNFAIVRVAKNATATDIAAATPAKNVFDADATGAMTSGTWNATVSDLPVLGENEQYVVKEISVTDGKGQNITGRFTATLTNAKTINNAPETTAVTVSKTWSPATPQDVTATLSLYKGKTPETATTKVTDITLNGQTGDAEAIDANDASAGQKQKTAAWTASFTNLPKYGYDETTGVYEIAYVIKEDTVPQGYYVTYNNDHSYALNGETVTNTLYTLDIKIEKVSAGQNPVPLNGAVFKLTKHVGTNNGTDNWAAVTGVETSYVDSEGAPIRTDSEGKFTVNGNITLKNLLDGRYKLEEITPPSGYIITYRYPVEFTISNGAVANNNSLQQNVTYTAKRPATESQTAVDTDTYTIPNEEGAALPATGGSGTGWIYATGAGLLLLAALGLILIRRKRSEGAGIR